MMRLTCALTFAAAALITIACGGAANVATNVNTGSANKIKSDADVPRIGLADAKKAFDAGDAIIVDARPANNYAQEHIAGSINIPFGPDADVSKLPKGKKIIVYCS